MKHMGKRNGVEPTFDEAERYWKNARELLRRCPGEGDFYSDMKPVREAFGTAWLAINTAVKACLLAKGIPRKQIPRSWDGLLAGTSRHLGSHNGKLIHTLNQAYELVHLGGYYYGDLTARPVAVAAMDVAKHVIEKLARRKIA